MLILICCSFQYNYCLCIHECNYACAVCSSWLLYIHVVVFGLIGCCVAVANFAVRSYPVCYGVQTGYNMCQLT